MNRRRLLAMLPVLPLAVVAGPETVGAVPEPEPLDTRVTYRRSDYVMFRPAGPAESCRACGSPHEFYTHGCRPIAFKPTHVKYRDGQTVPVTDDAVPDAYTSGLCAFNNGGAIPAPHQHNDFRWVA